MVSKVYMTNTRPYGGVGLLSTTYSMLDAAFRGSVYRQVLTYTAYGREDFSPTVTTGLSSALFVYYSGSSRLTTDLLGTVANGLASSASGSNGIPSLIVMVGWVHRPVQLVSMT